MAGELEQIDAQINNHLSLESKLLEGLQAITLNVKSKTEIIRTIYNTLKEYENEFNLLKPKTLVLLNQYLNADDADDESEQKAKIDSFRTPFITLNSKILILLKKLPEIMDEAPINVELNHMRKLEIAEEKNSDENDIVRIKAGIAAAQLAIKNNLLNKDVRAEAQKLTNDITNFINSEIPDPDAVEAEYNEDQPGAPVAQYANGNYDPRTFANNQRNIQQAPVVDQEGSKCCIIM